MGLSPDKGNLGCCQQHGATQANDGRDPRHARGARHRGVTRARAQAGVEASPPHPCARWASGWASAGRGSVSSFGETGRALHSASGSGSASRSIARSRSHSRGRSTCTSRVMPATSPHRNWCCGWSDRPAAGPTSNRRAARPTRRARSMSRSATIGHRRSSSSRSGTGSTIWAPRLALRPARYRRPRATRPPRRVMITHTGSPCAGCSSTPSANRRLVGRYPEIMRSRFPGSSVAWVRCIVGGTPPPDEPGCAWIDPRSERVLPMRLRRPRNAA